MAHARAELLATEGNGRWSDFGIRLASALILAPVALLALWHGGVAWDLLIAVMLAGLGWEWARLTKAPGARFLLPGGLLLAVAVVLAFGWLAGLAMLAVLTGLLAWRFGWFLGLGVPYAGLGGVSLLWLRLHGQVGLRDTLFLVAVVWGTDIGAYLVGRVIGGRKLAPRISPGKTWSGAVGGLLLAGVAGVILTGMNGLALPVALLLSLFAQSGDLLESAIKRQLGVKDSGNTIPGHGGLFDRLDGFLAAAPLAALLAVCGGLPLWR